MKKSSPFDHQKLNIGTFQRVDFAVLPSISNTARGPPAISYANTLTFRNGNYSAKKFKRSKKRLDRFFLK
jgi:hypothetical protein